MIKIEVLNLAWEPGKEINKQLPLEEQLKFEDWIALEFVKMVQKSVNEQRYRAKWVPLSLAYLAYKRERGWSLKTWEATGELISNLQFKKADRSIGFDAGKRHAGSEETYLSIARRLEYGDLKVPPRPLFRQVYWYMRKNVRYFYNKYLKEGGQ